MPSSSTFSTIYINKPRRFYKIRKFFFITVLLLSLGTSLEARELKEYKATRPYLGAYVTIQCFYEADQESLAAEAIQKCWGRMDQIQQEMNAYAQEGDVAEINRNGPQGVRVRQDVYRLLKDSLHFAQLAEGAFDVTVFPLVELWKDAEAQGRFPDQAELKAARDKVGYQNLRLEEPDRVVLAKPGMKVDLGGIVAGFACDEIAAILGSYGIKDFLVDTGGEIFCRGKNKGSEPWLVGIQDPQDKQGILMTIELNDSCASTSGNYEKFYTIEGTSLSHIIDPVSGYPQKDIISATVIAKSAELADALSTALCVMGSEKGMALIRRLDSVEALIIENKDGVTRKTQTEKFP